MILMFIHFCNETNPDDKTVKPDFIRKQERHGRHPQIGALDSNARRKKYTSLKIQCKLNLYQVQF
jgi:hypothetical protein